MCASASSSNETCKTVVDKAHLGWVQGHRGAAHGKSERRSQRRAEESAQETLQGGRRQADVARQREGAHSMSFSYRGTDESRSDPRHGEWRVGGDLHDWLLHGHAGGARAHILRDVPERRRDSHRDGHPFDMGARGARAGGCEHRRTLAVARPCGQSSRHAGCARDRHAIHQGRAADSSGRSADCRRRIVWPAASRRKARRGIGLQ